MIVEFEEEKGDLKPQTNPFPPTIPEKDTFAAEVHGTGIPPGKLVQLREELIKTQTTVWLEFSEIATVESEETDGKE